MIVIDTVRETETAIHLEIETETETEKGRGRGRGIVRGIVSVIAIVREDRGLLREEENGRRMEVAEVVAATVLLPLLADCPSPLGLPIPILAPLQRRNRSLLPLRKRRTLDVWYV